MADIKELNLYLNLNIDLLKQWHQFFEFSVFSHSLKNLQNIIAKAENYTHFIEDESDLKLYSSFLDETNNLVEKYFRLFYEKMLNNPQNISKSHYNNNNVIIGNLEDLSNKAVFWSSIDQDLV
ncbi:MAG: hypothetical protein MHPSP_004551, partial [Paramarteilia canceri]